jgi:hypothetical protein
VTRKQGDVKRLSWCTCEITKEMKERPWDRFGAERGSHGRGGEGEGGGRGRGKSERKPERERVSEIKK